MKPIPAYIRVGNITLCDMSFRDRNQNDEMHSATCGHLSLQKALHDAKIVRKHFCKVRVVRGKCPNSI